MGRTSLLAKLAFTNVAIVLIPFSITVYLVFSRLMDGAVREQKSTAYYAARNVQATLEAKIDNLNRVSRSLIMSDSIRTYAASAAASDRGKEFEVAYANAAETLSLFVFQDRSISGISFFTRAGKAITAGVSPEIDLSDEDRSAAEAMQGGWFWSIQGGRISMCRLVRNIHDFSDWLGYLKISIDKNELGRLLVPSYRLDNVAFALAGANGALISHDLGSEEATLLEKALADDGIKPASDGMRIHLGSTRDKSAYLAWTSLLKDGRTFLVVVEKDKARAYRRQYYLIGALAILLIVAISLAHLGLYVRFIFKPLNRLEELMKSIEDEDFSARFETGVSNEISRLVDQFNRMSGKLRFLHEEVYSSNLKLKEAELKELQAEINPHFLFNTLDTIYWMISLRKTEQAGNMVRQLSSMLRLSLGKATDSLVPLDREVEHIRCYLALQKERYENRLTYSIDVQEGLGSPMVLKLALQPIVENSVLHGIEPKGGGEIIITIEAADDCLVYRVYDDGLGIDPDAISDLLSRGASGQKTESLALLNINERIRLKFGAAYGVTGLRPQDGGSVFIVKQPMWRRADPE